MSLWSFGFPSCLLLRPLFKFWGFLREIQFLCIYIFLHLYYFELISTPWAFVSLVSSGISVFLCTFLFWLWKKFLPFSKYHLSVAGQIHGWVNVAMSPVSSLAHHRCFVHWMYSRTRQSISTLLSLTLLSGFLRMCSKNLAFFSWPLSLSLALLFDLGILTYSTPTLLEGHTRLL